MNEAQSPFLGCVRGACVYYKDKLRLSLSFLFFLPSLSLLPSLSFLPTMQTATTLSNDKNSPDDINQPAFTQRGHASTGHTTERDKIDTKENGTKKKKRIMTTGSDTRRSTSVSRLHTTSSSYSPIVLPTTRRWQRCRLD